MIERLITTPAQAIERAAQIADEWAAENKASAAKARKSINEGCQNMAEMLDGAAIECNAIAAEIRKLAVGSPWQPIDTMPLWEVGVVTDGENVARSQKAESDFGGHYFAVDPEDALEWEPTLWIATPKEDNPDGN